VRARRSTCLTRNAWRRQAFRHAGVAVSLFSTRYEIRSFHSLATTFLNIFGNDTFRKKEWRKEDANNTYQSVTIGFLFDLKISD
jgi:hypothetical protein